MVKLLLAVVGVVLLIAVAVMFFNIDFSSPEAFLQSISVAPTTIPAGTFTVDDVSRHNNADDCWIILEDKVYNVTSILTVQTNKNLFLRSCGQDMTERYSSSDSIGNILAGAYIGKLAK